MSLKHGKMTLTVVERPEKVGRQNYEQVLMRKLGIRKKGKDTRWKGFDRDLPLHESRYFILQESSVFITDTATTHQVMKIPTQGILYLCTILGRQPPPVDSGKCSKWPALPCVSCICITASGISRVNWVSPISSAQLLGFPEGGGGRPWVIIH